MTFADARLILIVCIAVSGVYGPITRADVSQVSHERLEEIHNELDTLPVLVPSLQTHRRIGFHGHAVDPAWVMIDFEQQVTPERIVLFPARPAVAEQPPSPGFPAELEIEISATAEFQTSVRIARWAEESDGSGEFVEFLSFPGNRASGRFLRVRVTGFRNDPLQPGLQYFRLGEVVVLENGRNVSLGRRVTSTASTEISRRWEAMNVTDGYFWCLPLRGRRVSPTNGYQSEMVDQPVVSDRTWVEVDLGTTQRIDAVHLVPAHPKDFVDLPGYGFPSHFRLLADSGTPDEKLLLDELEPAFPGEALPNPGSAQVMINTAGVHARRLRVTCEAVWRRGPGPGSGLSPSVYLMALAELQAWQDGRNVAAGKTVTFANRSNESTWRAEALTDGFSSREDLLDWTTWLNGIQRSAELQAEADRIQAAMDGRAEASRQRLVWGAVGSTVVITLLGLIVVLWLRARAARMREELRARIARDLHDEIGAGLSHLAIQSDLARRQLEQGESVVERLEAMSDTTRQTLDHMRDVIWLLVPKASHWGELSNRLQSIASRILEGVEYRIVEEGDRPDGKPPIECSRNLVTFLKEVLTNVRKHSHADDVSVTLTWGQTLLLVVEDNGQGFDTDAARSSGGTGLENLRHRASLLKASLEIQSKPSQGTQIRLAVPLPSG